MLVEIFRSRGVEQGQLVILVMKGSCLVNCNITLALAAPPHMDELTILLTA